MRSKWLLTGLLFGGLIAYGWSANNNSNPLKELGYINVKDFGAIGDGKDHPLTPDEATAFNARYQVKAEAGDQKDWAAIQAALQNWFQREIPGTLYLPPGNYQVNKPIHLYINKTITYGWSIVGGPATITNQTAPADYIFYVENGFLKGTKYPDFKLVQARKLQIRDLLFSGGKNIRKAVFCINAKGNLGYPSAKYGYCAIYGSQFKNLVVNYRTDREDTAAFRFIGNFFEFSLEDCVAWGPGSPKGPTTTYKGAGFEFVSTMTDNQGRTWGNNCPTGLCLLIRCHAHKFNHGFRNIGKSFEGFRYDGCYTMFTGEEGFYSQYRGGTFLVCHAERAWEKNDDPGDFSKAAFKVPGNSCFFRCDATGNQAKMGGARTMINLMVRESRYSFPKDNSIVGSLIQGDCVKVLYTNAMETVFTDTAPERIVMVGNTCHTKPVRRMLQRVELIDLPEEKKQGRHVYPNLACGNIIAIDPAGLNTAEGNLLSIGTPVADGALKYYQSTLKDSPLFRRLPLFEGTEFTLLLMQNNPNRNFDYNLDDAYILTKPLPQLKKGQGILLKFMALARKKEVPKGKIFGEGIFSLQSDKTLKFNPKNPWETPRQDGETWFERKWIRNPSQGKIIITQQQNLWVETKRRVLTLP